MFYFSQLFRYLWVRSVSACAVYRGCVDGVGWRRCSALNGVLFEFSLFSLSFLMFGVVGGGVGVGTFGYWWVVLAVFVPVSWYKDSGAS